MEQTPVTQIQRKMHIETLVKTDGIWTGNLKIFVDEKENEGLNNKTPSFNFINNYDVEKSLKIKFEGINGQNLALEIKIDAPKQQRIDGKVKGIIDLLRMMDTEGAQKVLYLASKEIKSISVIP